MYWMYFRTTDLNRVNCYSPSEGFFYQQVKESRVSVQSWIVGIGLTTALCWLFIVSEPSSLFWLSVSILLVSWGLWALKYPFPAFVALALVWVTVYSRANIPMFTVGGSANRGGISLGDLLWLIYTAVWLVYWGRQTRWSISRPTGHIHFVLIALIPYLVLSVLLPCLGVLIWDYPASYAIPGIRYLQWTAFALFSYGLSQCFGTKTLLYTLLLIFTFAGVIHGIYALIQILTTIGVLQLSWLYLDHIYADRFSMTWFFYPRTTGLCVNPNDYGLFGSIALVLYWASLTAKVRTSPWIGSLLGLTGLWSVMSSASRTALVGLVAGAVLVGSATWLGAILHRDANRLMHFTLFWCGWKYGMMSQTVSAWLGLSLIGITGLVGASSFTHTPLQVPTVLVPFWTLIGIGLSNLKNRK